jgi:cell division GTPase FtsZ
LTLQEVNDVLYKLNKQTGPQTDIVFGVINDEKMDGRAQVILVVTGLGATTLEEAVTQVHQLETVGPQRHHVESVVSQVEVNQAERNRPLWTVGTSNHELPAFLRSRFR